MDDHKQYRWISAVTEKPRVPVPGLCSMTSCLWMYLCCAASTLLLCPRGFSKKYIAFSASLCCYYLRYIERRWSDSALSFQNFIGKFFFFDAIQLYHKSTLHANRVRFQIHQLAWSPPGYTVLVCTDVIIRFSLLRWFFPADLTTACCHLQASEDIRLIRFIVH